MQMLRVNKDFTPCPIEEGDELFSNGIFEFNVTRMLQHIENNPADVVIVEVAVNDFFQEFSSVDEPHVESVDITRPLLIAEISPGHYNLIDGHHRVEKARRLGVGKMQAYQMTVLQHLAFLTSKKAYLLYVEYWNSKLKTTS